MNTFTGFFPFEYRKNGMIDLEKLMQETPAPPRYLIRVHSAASQGAMADNLLLSSAELFSTQRNVDLPRVQDYSSAQFERCVHHHLTNYKGNSAQPFLSPFISLTTSLRTAIGWAKLRSLWRHPDIRIVVLDTSTINESNCDCNNFCRNPFHQNPIWSANMVYKICHGKTKDYPDEFLAFGHVRGIFKVCTFTELETTILQTYLPELSRLSRDQRYDDLPDALDALWRMEQKVQLHEKELIVHIAKQLSNDNLLIPMVAFVLCMRRRSVNDKHALDTIVRAARLVEKQAIYDFLGNFDAFPIIDFFSRTQVQKVITADSAELVQTSAILERVRFSFAEKQEREAHLMWNCTTVALICKFFCPPNIGNVITRASLQPRRTITNDLARAFSRLQQAVFRSKFRGLRLLKNALVRFEHGGGALSAQRKHELWTQTFKEIAAHIEAYDGPLSIVNYNMGDPLTTSKQLCRSNGGEANGPDKQKHIGKDGNSFNVLATSTTPTNTTEGNDNILGDVDLNKVEKLPIGMMKQVRFEQEVVASIDKDLSDMR